MKIENLKVYKNITNNIIINNNYIISAETGTGKTLSIPAIYYKKYYNDINKIYVIEPRRIACLQPSKLLKKLGFNTSFYFKGIEKNYGLSGKIIFITDGMFLNIINEIKENDIVILDEFHERNMNQDIILGVLKKRGHKNIIITSATITETLVNNKYFENFKKIEIPGEKNFPVEIQEKYFYYENISGLTNNIEEIDKYFSNEYHIINEVIENLNEKRILIFLSGIDRIKEVQKRLEEKLKKLNRNKKITIIHANLSDKKDFDVLFNDEETIILSTNVAQTSITPKNLDLVIISGFKNKIIERDGILFLEEVPISISDMKQQIGRVGRTRAGKAIIINTLDQDKKYTKNEIPEIISLPLENVLLRTLNLGYKIEDIDLLDKPNIEKIEKGYKILNNLNLIENYKLTEKGTFVNKLGIDVLYGSIIYELRKSKNLKKLLLAISIINNIQSLLYFNTEKKDEITKKREEQKNKFGNDDFTLWTNFLIDFINNYIYNGNIINEGFEYLKNEFIKSKTVKRIIEDYEILYDRIFGNKYGIYKIEFINKDEMKEILEKLYYKGLIYKGKYYRRYIYEIYKYDIINKEEKYTEIDGYIHPSSVLMKNVPTEIYFLTIRGSKKNDTRRKNYLNVVFDI